MGSRWQLLLLAIPIGAGAWLDLPRYRVAHQPIEIPIKELHVYVSKRQIPLIYQGQPPTGTAVLTMESYCKWYCAYAIHPDGSVTEHEIELWDHIPPPEAVAKLAKDTGYVWQDDTIDMITGRWFREHYASSKDAAEKNPYGEALYGVEEDRSWLRGSNPEGSGGGD